jgi:hypothetical protein
MQTSRNRLLITLAVLCVTVLAASQLVVSPASAGQASGGSVVATSYSKPGSTPNAGEPDVSGGQMPQPSHYSQSLTSRGSGTLPVTRGMYVTLASRWARAFWMARYLGLSP